MSQIKGMVKVDAYWIPAADAPAYIAARQRTVQRVDALLRQFCVDVQRCWQGSQDGEAVVGRDANGDIIALLHLDPQDVQTAESLDDAQLLAWLRQDNGEPS